MSNYFNAIFHSFHFLSGYLYFCNLQTGQSMAVWSILFLLGFNSNTASDLYQGHYEMYNNCTYSILYVDRTASL